MPRKTVRQGRWVMVHKLPDAAPPVMITVQERDQMVFDEQFWTEMFYPNEAAALAAWDAAANAWMVANPSRAGEVRPPVLPQ